MSADEVELLKASKHGDVDKVRSLTKKGINVNYQNVNGLSALHLASKEGHVDVLKELIKGGALVDAISSKGNTSLHIASLCGKEDLVDLLIKSGANVNLQSLQGFTALYMAAQENHLAIATKLLKSGADPFLSTQEGFTPMDVAQQLDFKPVVQLLESYGVSHSRKKSQGHSRHTSTFWSNTLPGLHAAAKREDLECMDKILGEGIPIDGQTKSGFTALHISCHYGKVKAAKYLIEKGADVNFTKARNCITPLHVAAKWGFKDLIILLLQQKAYIESRTKDGLTPLHCAARFGKAVVIETLLDLGAEIDPGSQNGLTPLHMSVQGDFDECVRLLLSKGAFIEATTVDHLTPLHVAAHCGHVKCAEVLLQNNCNPKAEALNGFTPLHIACKKNRIPIIELLLSYYGNNVNIKTKAGLSPLHIASFMGHVALLEVLTSKGADLNSATIQQETPLHLAIRADQFDCIHYLVDRGADINAITKNECTPLHLASQLGNQRIVSFLLKRGASPDCQTKNKLSPLHLASREGYATIVDELLTAGADKELASKRGLTPLHFASKFGNYEVVHLLLKHGSSVMASDKNGFTPLHYAVQEGHHNVVRTLLEHGSDSHSIAKNGFTPLHLAALYSRYQIAKLLLEKYEANPLAKSLNGYTPVHVASKEGYHELLALMLASLQPGNREFMADVQSNDGVHPLHLASQENHIPVLQLLLKNSLSPDPVDKNFFTPLHLACYHGNLDSVKILLDHNANPNKANKNGFTPLHLAAQEGNSVVVAILLDSKANPNILNQTSHTALHLAQAHGFMNTLKILEPVTEVNAISTGDVVKLVPSQIIGESAIVDSDDEIESEKVKTSDFASLPEDSQNFVYVANQNKDNVFGTVAIGGLQPADRSISRELRYLNDEAEFSVASILLSQKEGEDGRTMERSAESSSVGLRYRYLQPPRYLDSRASSINTSHSALLSDGSGSRCNLDLGDSPIQSGFLVSFIVDARGKAMYGMRHTGVRIIVSPGKTSGPIRVTCKLVNPAKMNNPPPLMEGEGLASRILKMGPSSASFDGPVVIEVPHFASLQEHQREIMILRSDDGEIWREHVNKFPLSEVHNIIKNSFGEELSSAEELYQYRVARIITCDFPKYFALVSTLAHDKRVIGPSGGEMISSTDPRVVVGIPNNAFNKKIHIKLQVQKIPENLRQKMEENGIFSSPAVTVEPRRRKFHQPVTIKIPVPQTGDRRPGKLCLLCSLSEGQGISMWEDITDKSSLRGDNECVYFHTSVSGRFWLVNTSDPNITPAYCGKVYQELCRVPYYSKFVLLARRSGINKGILRIICSTEGKLHKTLEGREHYKELAQTPETELLEKGKYLLNFSGNLDPYQKMEKGPLDIMFEPFKENHVSTGVYIRDLACQPRSELCILQEATSFSDEKKISIFDFVLPDFEETSCQHPEDHGDAMLLEIDQSTGECLDFSELSHLLGRDWVKLADAFGINDSDVMTIKQRNETPEQEAQDFLKQLTYGVKDKETISRGLEYIRRQDALELWGKMNEAQELKFYFEKFFPNEKYEKYTWQKQNEGIFYGYTEMHENERNCTMKQIITLPINLNEENLDVDEKEFVINVHQNDGTKHSKYIKRIVIMPRERGYNNETKQEIVAKEFQLSEVPFYTLEDRKPDSKNMTIDGTLQLKRIFKKAPGAKKEKPDIIEEVIEVPQQVNETEIIDYVVETVETRLDKVKLDDGRKGSKVVRKTVISPKAVVVETPKPGETKVAPREVVQERPEDRLIVAEQVISETLPGVDLTLFQRGDVKPGQTVVLRKKISKPEKPSETIEETIELEPGVENLGHDNVEVSTRTREIREYLPDGQFVTKVLKKTIVRPKGLPSRKEPQQEILAKEFQLPELPSFELDVKKGESRDVRLDGTLVLTRIFKKSPGVEGNEPDVVEEVVETVAGVDGKNADDVIVECFETRLDKVKLDDGRKGSKVIRKSVISPKAVVVETPKPGEAKVSPREVVRDYPISSLDFENSFLPQAIRSREIIVLRPDIQNVDGNTLFVPQATHYPNIETFFSSFESGIITEPLKFDSSYLHLVPGHLKFAYEFPLPETPFVENYKSTVLKPPCVYVKLDANESDSNYHLMTLGPSKVVIDCSPRDRFETLVEISQKNLVIVDDSTHFGQRKKDAPLFTSSNNIFTKSDEGGSLYNEIQETYTSNFESEIADTEKLYTTSVTIGHGDLMSRESESDDFETGEEWSIINDAFLAGKKFKNRLAMERTVGPDGEIIERLITEEYLSDKSDSSSRRSSIDSESITGKEVEKLDPLGLSGDIDKIDSDFKPLTVFTHTLEQDPVYETETTEHEDTLPDGTVVRRRVIKTNKKQTIIKRVILEGPGDEEPFSDLNSAATVPHIPSNKQQITRYSDHSSADPEITTDVQAFEERLEDGTIIRKRITNTKHQQLTTERLVVSGTGLFECSKEGEEDVLDSLKHLSLPSKEQE